MHFGTKIARIRLLWPEFRPRKIRAVSGATNSGLIPIRSGRSGAADSDRKEIPIRGADSDPDSGVEPQMELQDDDVESGAEISIRVPGPDSDPASGVNRSGVNSDPIRDSDPGLGTPG